MVSINKLFHLLFLTVIATTSLAQQSRLIKVTVDRGDSLDYYISEKDGKYGVIDPREKRYIIDQIYDTIYDSRFRISRKAQDLILRETDGRYSFYDLEKQEFKKVGDILSYSDKEDVFLLWIIGSENIKLGYLDSDGYFITPQTWDIAFTFGSYDVAIVAFYEGNDNAEIDYLESPNRKYGYINKKGEYVIPPIYSYIGFFEDGLRNTSFTKGESYYNWEGQVRYNGKWGIISFDGKILVNDDTYDYIFPRSLMDINLDLGYFL